MANPLSSNTAYTNSERKQGAYTDKDKQSLISSLSNCGVNLSSITNNLNSFKSFMDFMIKDPFQTDKKLGVYITDVMKYDDSKYNRTFGIPSATHKKKLGDCDDGAILSIYTLVKAGYKKDIKDGQIPIPARLYDNNDKVIKTLDSLADSIYKFPILVGISTDPLSTPLSKSVLHGVCVYSELDTGLINIIETSDGLTETKAKNLIESISKFEPKWQRIIIKHVENGRPPGNVPYIMIERSDVEVKKFLPSEQPENRPKIDNKKK